MNMPNPQPEDPGAPLDRPGINVALIVQGVFLVAGAAGLSVDSLEEPVQVVVAGVAVLITAVTEWLKRRSTTPVVDPRDNAGRDLRPLGR